MIIDQVLMAGADSYLRSADGAVDAAGSGTATVETTPVSEGIALQVSGLQIYLEHDDLLSLFAHRNAPLLSVSVRRELFPGLVQDPYAVRAHQAGGFEDFGRGELSGCRAAEVDGRPTLVSAGTGTASWVSGVFRMPVPADFTDAAWDLASARTASADAFTYHIVLDYWVNGTDLSAPPQSMTLAASLNPAATRAVTGLTLSAVQAYRIRFSADVRHDTYLSERTSAAGRRSEPAGRPLLRTVTLLESITSRLLFSSLTELTLASSAYHLLHADGVAPQAMTAVLPVPATLLAGDRIEVRLLDSAIRRLEARLDAMVLVRSPSTMDS